MSDIDCNLEVCSNCKKYISLEERPYFCCHCAQLFCKKCTGIHLKELKNKTIKTSELNKFLEEIKSFERPDFEFSYQYLGKKQLTIQCVFKIELQELFEKASFEYRSQLREKYALVRNYIDIHLIKNKYPSIKYSETSYWRERKLTIVFYFKEQVLLNGKKKKVV